MTEEIKEQAEQFIKNADYATLRRAVGALPPDELRKFFLDLPQVTLACASREMGEKNPLALAKKGEDPLDLVDLMPRLLIERVEKRPGKDTLTKGDIYEFDEISRHYIKTGEKIVPAEGMVFVPGMEIYMSLSRNYVWEWINFEGFSLAVLPENHERYEILCIIPKEAVFLVGRRGKRGRSKVDISLFRVTSENNWVEVKTGMGIVGVFPLESDKILVSGIERKAEIRSLRMLTLLDKISLPPVSIQISPIDFAVSLPEEEGMSRIQRYTGRTGDPFRSDPRVGFEDPVLTTGSVFKVLQTIPSVKIVLEPNTLLCSDSCFPYSHSLWKRKSRDSEYEEIMTVSVQGHAFGLGSSLTYTVSGGGTDSQVNLQKLGRFDAKNFQVFPGRKCHTLSPTKSSRRGLVDKLKGPMEAIPLDVVDVVVGFL